MGAFDHLIPDNEGGAAGAEKRTGAFDHLIPKDGQPPAQPIGGAGQQAPRKPITLADRAAGQEWAMGKVKQGMRTLGEAVGLVEPPSVLDDPAVHKGAERPQSAAPSMAPVDAKMRQQFNAAWDAATPEQRTALSQRNGWIGQLARERAGLYDNPQATITETGRKFDTRAESRVDRLVGQGEDPRFAQVAAQRGALGAVTPGQEVAAMGDTIQPSKFDFDTAAQFDPDAPANGLNRTLGRGLAKGGAGLTKAVAGYGEALSDFLGTDAAGQVMKELGDWARGKEDAIGNRGDFLQRNMEGAIASIAQQLPLLALGAANSSQAIPLAGMAVQVFGQEYSDGRDAKLTPQEAATRASLMASFEVIGEKFGLGQQLDLLRRSAKGVETGQLANFFGEWIGNTLKREIPGELLTTTGQFGVDKFGGEIALNPNATWADYTQQVADTIGQTIMQGGIMAGGTTGVGAAADYMRSGGEQSQAQAEAEALAARDRALRAWENARAKGFLVEPPAPTDKPSVRRSKSVEMFKELGAMFGIPQAAQDLAIQHAEKQPVQALPGFFARYAQALQKRGLVGADLDPDVLEAMRSAEMVQAPVEAPAQVQQADAIAAVPQGSLLDAMPAATGLAEDVAPAQPQAEAPTASVDISTPVDAAAHQAATSPTNDLPEPSQAMKDAGNYKVGRTRIAGLDIRIENPQGSKRRGTAPDGTPWETEMRAHYGYVAGTEAADGDKLDVFVKAGTPEDWRGPVFVIDQVDPATGELDEHKVVMGVADEAEAEALYRSNYDADWQGFGAITRLPLPAFKAWAKSGRLKEPLGDIAARPQLAPDRKPTNEPQPSQAQPASTAAQADQAPADQGRTAEAGSGEAGRGVPGAGATATAEAPGLKASAAAQRGRQQFQVDPERDTMLQALAKMGGIRRDVVASEFGLKPEELKFTVSTGKLKAYPFRKTGGMNLDQAMTALTEAGYFDAVAPDDVRTVFEEAIYSEMGGSPRYTSRGDMRRAEDAYNDQAQEAQAELDAEALAEREAIMAEAGLTDQQLSAHPDQAIEIEARPQSIADGMRAMGFTEQEIADELAKAGNPTLQGREGSRAQDPEIANRQAQAPPRAGNAETRPAGGDRRDARAAGSDAGQTQGRQGEQEGLTLQAQTEQDLRTKAEREDAATKAEAAKKAAEQARLKQADDQRDTRARADATVDDFQLGQTADQQLSGMGDLFAQQDGPGGARGEGAEGARPTPAAQPSANTIFTEDAAAAARARLKAKLGRVQSGIDPEMLMDGLTLAGYHIEKGARTFAAFARAMLEDLGEGAKPYLKSWYMGVKYDPRAAGFTGMSTAAEVESADLDAIADNQAQEGNDDVPSTSTDLERDRTDATRGQRVLAVADGEGSAAADRGTGEAGSRAGAQGGRRSGDAVVPAGSTTAARDSGDQPVRGRTGKPGASLVPAGSDIDQRGGGFGDRGIPVETVSADATRRAAQDGLAQGLTNQAQRLAPTQIKLGDIDNIRATLPALLPGQQDDVLKAEKRFAQPDGYGILFTNGTGTGKTHLGLGIVKRWTLQGKENILLAAPSDKVIEDWINSGKTLGLNITKLASTKDAGKGIVITTYANLGDNMVLGDRRWDGAVLDEAHYLMSSKDGTTTKALKTLRAITLHPDGVSDLGAMRNRELAAKVKDLSDKIKSLDKIMGLDDLTFEVRASYQRERDALEKQYLPLSEQLKEANGRVREEVLTNQEGKRPRVTFLSATPWAYVQALDWSNGYLFEFDEGKKQDGASGTGGRAYNEGSNRQQFYMQHFGYRMRYNKLTRPDAKVDVGLMERQFNAWLRQQGVLSRRALDVAADYDRRFILLESAIGTRIDEALSWVGERAYGNKEAGIEGSKAFQTLSAAINDKFDYLSRRYLLEAIKATEVIPIVRQHLAKGRKVVVFHDFKKGGGFNPFAIKSANAGQAMTAEESDAFNEALFEFQGAFPDLINYPFERMPSPIEVFSREFPDLLLFNGDVAPKDRREAVKTFQDDATGPRVILVQSAAGKEGISLHDTTGKHQRALINLGQPTAPTTAIQQEGRIYRTGQVTDAILRYLTTGTTWERYAFASQVATRSATVENLAAGEEARALADAFIAAYEEADTFEPGHEGEGTGGKQRDKAAYEALTEFDRAVSFYYGTQKKNAKTKAKEGADYFATPEPLGLKMVEWANVHAGDSVLEPSAGHGAIARWFPQSAQRTAVEPSLELRSRLAMVFGDGKIVGGDFESHHVVNKYDAIVMNPPFGSGGRTAVDHLAKAADHLREGGRIVAIIPTGPAADKKFDKWFYEENTKPVKPLTTIEYGMGPQELFRGDMIKTRASFAPQGTVLRMNAEGTGVWVKVEGKPGETMVTLQSITAHARSGPRTETYKPAEGLHLVADLKLPQVAFERAGTNVATRVVVIEKTREGEVAPAQRNADFTGAESVEDFFKRIRDYSLPKRAKPEPTLEELTGPETEAPKADARQVAKAEKATAQRQGTELAAGAGMDIVEHVTAKGKTLKGVIRKDMTQAQAKEIDAYTFKKDGGWFIRAEHIPKMVGGVAQEPAAQYSAREQESLFTGDDTPTTGRLGYETDLFGNPLPTSAGRLAPARPAGAGVRGDTQPVASVQDTPAPAGRYRVRTIVGSEQRRKLGVGVIKTPAQAARATAYLYRSPVERFDGIVTDADGKPLAIVGGFKGAISQASVYPSTVLAEAVRIPGAARIWFSHNHPSGTPTLSRADEMLGAGLASAFDGSGIKPMGILAVAGQRYGYAAADGSDFHEGEIAAPVGSVSVPVIERELTQTSEMPDAPSLTSPQAARLAAKEFYGETKQPGLMLLDAQHKVAAWVPLAPEMMGRLKGTGGLNAIYRAVSESNANSVIIVHGGELSARRGDGSAWTIAQNLGAAARGMDVRVLDIIDVKSSRSAAEAGDDLQAGSVFSVAPVFISELAEQVQRSPMNAGTAGAWQQYLDALAKRGAIKADEVEWTGLREWLALQPGKISKADISTFLDANGVQVEDVTLGGPLGADLPDGWRVRETTEEDDTSFRYVLVDETDDARGYGNSRQEAIEDGWDTDEVQDAAPKFERWTVPGGQNYREVLLTLPRRAHPMESEVRALGIAKPLEDVTAKDILDAGGTRDQSHRWMESMTGTTFGNQYKSSHWDQPNVLAHIRVDERTDADGKRVLFVQEVQSDWGQQGKKKGIFNPAEPYEVFNVQTGETVARHSDMRAAAKDAVERGVMFDYKDERTSGFVPPAPFIGKTDAWVGLAIKRVIKMAADEGFDRVAFINGQQAADLFDLSKQVERIDYDQKTKNLVVYDKTGGRPITKTVTPEELPDVIGKEAAEKLLQAPGLDSGFQHSLRGLDLKVGGEGMRTFYDQIVPKVAKDVLRKVGGGQLTTMNLVTRNPGNARKPGAKPIDFISNGFDITPAIREKAARGLPLFSRGAADGVGAGVGGGSGVPGILGIGARPTFAPGPARPTVSRVDLDKLIVRNADNWAGIGLDRLIAVDNWAELPDQVLADARKKGFHPGLIEGVVHRNRVYLVRSALRNVDHAERVLFHEAYGHMGTRIALEGKPTEALNTLWDKLNGLAGVAKLAKKHQVGDGMTAWDRLQPYVRGTQEDVVSRRAKIMDELIAFLAQANDTSALTQFKTYLADLKGAMVALARRLGLNGLADRLDRAGAEMDVLQLVRDARRAVRTGTSRQGSLVVFGADPAPAFSEGEQAGQFSVATPTGFNLPEFGRTGKFVEAIQDRYNRWKQAVEAVRQQGGTVTEANDFYAAEERYWGIVGAQLDDFKAEVETFVKDVQADDLALSDVALYAYAKHAPERNARIAEINAAFPDGGSGMTNAQAAEILAKAQADGLTEKLERHVGQLQRWSARTREILRDNGLITPEEFDAWDTGYQHYVPLRGKPGQPASRGGMGQGFDIRGKESFRAMGRRSMAGNVIEHILQDRARALVRSGKNEVLRRFARFVLDNPDPQLWTVNAVKTRRALVNTPMGEQVVEWQELNDDRNETVGVKDAGRTLFIEVKDPVLLKQLKNLNDDVQLSVVVEALHWANRLLSRMYTSLNPVFTVLNGARDATAGTINMLGVAGTAGARRMAANLPGAYREAFRAEVLGKPSAMYEEYRRTGGKTGFMDFKDIEAYGDELAAIAAESQKWTEAMSQEGWQRARALWLRSRGTARRALERIEDLNASVENATRFAAFKAARETGKSVAEAASIAKNITVNFNRRGTKTPGLAALFLFFNPAVQGTTRMLQALQSRDVQAALGSAMVGVFALALANASMGDEDEGDGITYWDKIPENVKDRNLVIMLPPGSNAGEKIPGTEYGRYIKIPLPYGYNTFATLATTVADVARNQMDPKAGVTAAAGAQRVFKSFIGSWLPASDVAPSFDNEKSIALAFVPDAIDPVLEPVLNINSFGSAMYPEGLGYDTMPDSEKVFAGQRNGAAHQLATWMNEATGGSQYHEGAISVTPATINNVVRGYGGGVASFIMAVGDVFATQGVSRDTPEWWRAPFAKQLFGTVDMIQDQGLAYERLQQIDAAAVPLKRAEKAGDKRAAEAIRDDAGAIAGLGKMANQARQRLTEIRKQEIRIIESERMTPAEKNAALRQWDRERQRVYDRVNRSWARAVESDAYRSE